MKFIVVQSGARRGYAVPAALEEAGMLERFYTDLCADVGLGRLLVLARGLPLVGGTLAGLSSRRLPPNIRARTRTFALPFVPELLVRRSQNHAANHRQSLERHRRWSEAMVREGLGNATHLFSMLNEAGSLIGHARARGLKAVCEIYLLLSTNRVLKRERSEFPEWEPSSTERGAGHEESEIGDQMLEHSNLCLCPSEIVRDDLVRHWGFSNERTAIVPYGMDPRWLDLKPTPQRGRVLFAGTAELRKGIHYFAMAAEELIRRGRRCEFRVAGNVSATVAGQSACRHLTFLGRVPREDMPKEFQSADMFVLPSLAEGSAEATYEAMASELPVITTASAGSVVRDGMEGRIVPERDAMALADAIEQLLDDRSLRDRFASAARERARSFTWQHYGTRLLGALAQLA